MAELTESLAAGLLKEQKAFFESGSTLSYEYRIAQLRKLKCAVLSFQTELEKALASDLGKSRQESFLTEIGFVLSDITHTCRALKKWMKPVAVRSPLTVFPSRSFVLHQPYGSVLIIGPYNYPFQLLIGPLVAAIAAGNCAVLSPSELTPHVSETVRKLIAQTFDPKYVFCAAGGIEDNRILLSSRFDKIFFTGSVRVGKIVMRAAAENLVPVTLELGGKSPVIVDETARIGVACERIVWGKFMNAGQTCVAPDYVFVHKSAFEPFLRTLQETIVRFYGQDPQKSPDYGRIVNDRHMQRLEAILERDKASVVFGGETDRTDRFIAPTVLCPPDIRAAACMEEEIFGPLLPVFCYENLQEVLSYINGGEKPLALYVFSENKAAVGRILGATSSGGVCVNDTISHLINPNLPFGGVGHSGMGNYHGEYGFRTFSHSRSVLKRSSRIRITVAYPPFSEKKLKNAQKLMK